MALNQAELSRAEWEIMNICWRTGEAPARVIYDASLADKQREYQTIKTMLDRLVEKGWLERRKLGALVMFKPAVPRTKALARAIDGFVNTVLDNAIAPMFAHFIKSDKLDEDDIKALEELIKKHKGN